MLTGYFLISPVRLSYLIESLRLFFLEIVLSYG